MNPSLTWYVAGPMSFRPSFNFPLFDRVTAKLREMGFSVISPAELDAPEIRAAAMASPDGEPGKYTQMANQTWADFLSRDVKLIADSVGGIVLLPEWETSRGARLEAFVGLLCSHKFVTWHEWSDDDAHIAIYPRDAEWVNAEIYHSGQP